MGLSESESGAGKDSSDPGEDPGEPGQEAQHVPGQEGQLHACIRSLVTYHLQLI